MHPKSLPLTVLLGLAIGLLIAIASAAVGYWQFQGVSRQISKQILDTSQSVQRYIHDQQIQHLRELSNGIAGNSSFASYIAEAMSSSSVPGQTRDVASIRDLLDERRKDAGLDAAAILDVNGKLVAATGDSFFSESDLSTLPQVAQTRKDGSQAFGILETDKRLPLIAVTAVTRGSGVEALLITGERFDEAALKRMAKIGQIDLALVVMEPTGARLVSSTLDAHDAQVVSQALGKLENHFHVGAGQTSAADDAELDFEGQWRSVRFVPFHASDDKVQLMALVPEAHRQSICKVMALPLIVGAIGGTIFSIVIALVGWFRVTRPLLRMAELSDRAAGGDHALQASVSGSPLVRKIGTALNVLLSQLDRYRVTPGTPRRRSTDRL